MSYEFGAMNYEIQTSEMQDLMREEISSIIQQEIKDPGIGFITSLM